MVFYILCLFIFHTKNRFFGMPSGFVRDSFGMRLCKKSKKRHKKKTRTFSQRREPEKKSIFITYVQNTRNIQQ